MNNKECLNTNESCSNCIHKRYIHFDDPVRRYPVCWVHRTVINESEPERCKCYSPVGDKDGDE